MFTLLPANGKFMGLKAYSSFPSCQLNPLSLGGRNLYMKLAVSRQEATELKGKVKKEQKDTRNLYLAREGMIRPGECLLPSSLNLSFTYLLSC